MVDSHCNGGINTLMIEEQCKDCKHCLPTLYPGEPWCMKRMLLLSEVEECSGAMGWGEQVEFEGRIGCGVICNIQYTEYDMEYFDWPLLGLTVIGFVVKWGLTAVGAVVLSKYL